MTRQRHAFADWPTWLAAFAATALVLAFLLVTGCGGDADSDDGAEQVLDANGVPIDGVTQDCSGGDANATAGNAGDGNAGGNATATGGDGGNCTVVIGGSGGDSSGNAGDQDDHSDQSETSIEGGA